MLLFASLLSSFTLIWVDPYGETPYLPSAFPKNGVVTNQLSLAAAKGEIETISFSLQPKRDMKSVDLVPSDLTSADGDVLPASAADMALVKVWFRAGGRWLTSWCGHVGKPELMNDLILHDDGLIKVDEQTTNMYLRVDYPAPVGSKYVDIKNKQRNLRFDHDLQPVRDAKKFVPFDLKKDRYQQYWLTYRVPAETKPGIYKGVVKILEDGKPLSEIPLVLEVYPFTLPRARTHYDTNQEYMSIWMGTPNLDSLLKGSKRLAVAEEKMRNIFKSLYEHNALQAGSPGDYKSTSADDLAVRSLLIMREEGLTMKPHANGPAAHFAWACPPEGPWLDPDKEPEAYQEALAKHKKLVDTHMEVLDKYLGHRECYFMSADECGTGTNRRSYGFWSYIHAQGAYTWTDSGVVDDITSFVNVNDIPASCRHSEAWKWRVGGAKSLTYAGTFTGPSCPALWRRLKGLRYYYQDFDGQHEYCFFDGRVNCWNDTVYHCSYGQFRIVYFTYDGLISTLAWEGVREGLDDIRYLSLLRMRAEAAMKSSDPKIRALGRSNFLWMDAIDPEAILDLFAFRREVARRITLLISAIGPQPEDPPMPKPAMKLPPFTYGKDEPANADKFALAKKYEKDNHWDLAIAKLAEIRTNPNETLDRRVDAAIQEATLQSGILNRTAAVKILDEMLALPQITRAQRGKLLQSRTNVLLTDVVYEEKYTIDQLSEAASSIAQLSKMAGLTEQERFDTILRMVVAYYSAGHYQKGIDYVDAIVKTTKFKNDYQAELFYQQALCYIKLENWKMACRLFDRAHQNITDYNNSVWKRKTLLNEAYAAEKCEDWKRAQRCYSDILSVYGSEEEDLKKNAEGNLVRVTKKAKKNLSADLNQAESESEVDISLDEF